MDGRASTRPWSPCQWGCVHGRGADAEKRGLPWEETGGDVILRVIGDGEKGQRGAGYYGMPPPAIDFPQAPAVCSPWPMGIGGAAGG
jgi:hypothetical protein